MPIPFPFDFKNPDYVEVFEWRLERLKRIREKPELLPQLKTFYKENPAQFIIDWGCTFDPRNPEVGLPAIVPFLLFPKQEEYVRWFLERWKTRTPGVVAKSREEGLSWLSVAISSTMCLFYDGIVAGFVSRTEPYVDKIGDPKSLFYKARDFIKMLPPEFRGGWEAKKHSSHLLITFPETGSKLSGEGGANAGRGGRASWVNKDESAWLMHPEAVEAALSATSNVIIDISTPNGMNNPFARKWFSGTVATFMVHWKDDPRKDQAWYDKKCEEINDPVIIAQEIDINFSASIEGVIIPSEWVDACVDAHEKLNIKITGARQFTLDVADRGRDINAGAGTHGILVEELEGWSGKNSDIMETTEKAIEWCDEFGYTIMYYDADGLGASVRGDARVVNEKRVTKGTHEIEVLEFNGSAATVDPEDDVYMGNGKGLARTNENYFQNHKAQGWFCLRRRCYLTYRAVMHGAKVNNPDELISISGKLKNLLKLKQEMSQPIFKKSETGKFMVDKLPDGARSPNYADSVMMAFAPKHIEPRGFLDV
jgi:phage terminase large subunit